MHEVGVASKRGATKPPEEERHAESQPRPGTQIADNPASVREPVVAEIRRRDNVDFHPAGRDRANRIRNETTRRVVRALRI